MRRVVLTVAVILLFSALALIGGGWAEGPWLKAAAHAGALGCLAVLWIGPQKRLSKGLVAFGAVAAAFLVGALDAGWLSAGQVAVVAVGLMAILVVVWKRFGGPNA